VNPYPLTELLELRRANVRQLELRLAADVAAAAAAERHVAALHARCEALRASIRSEQASQFDRARASTATAHELVQAAAHLARQQSDLAQLQRSMVDARVELERCLGASRSTQCSLNKSRRQLAAVQRHRARHLKRVQALHENRIEEESAEVWQAMRVGRPGGDS